MHEIRPATERIDRVLDAYNSAGISAEQMTLVIKNILCKSAAGGNRPEVPKLMVYELDLAADQHEL